MSLLWREQVRISLAPHQVALVRLRGMRGAVSDRKVLAIANETDNGSIGTIGSDSIRDESISSTMMESTTTSNGSSGHVAGTNGYRANGTAANWRGAIELLREMLAHHNVGRGGVGRIDAGVVLSNHYVRYLVLPWSAELVTLAEEAEFARMRFVQVFGEAANRWKVKLTPAPAGAGKVAAAIDQDLVDTLLQTVAGSPLRLRFIEPALMSQYNACRRQIGDDAWLVLAERGRVLIALIRDGEWRSVRTRPIGDAPLPLAQWLAQERLLLDAPAAPSTVYVSAVDDVAVDTQGVQVHTLSPRARDGFVPRADASLLLAMTGAA